MKVHSVIFIVALVGHGVVADDCVGRCGTFDLNAYTCQCNSECSYYGNCCDDYNTLCFGETDSCVGHPCSGLDSSKPCQCNSACYQHNDCCYDYENVCLNQGESCDGRCGNSNDPSKSCQCNSVCTQYGDCCADYNEKCTTGGGTSCNAISVSSKELLDASLALWDLNQNNAGEHQITYDIQGATSSSATNDVAPEPFFKYVDSEILSRTIFAQLRDLQDNYIITQGSTEVVTSEEMNEEDVFLDTVLDTAVGQYLFNFLESKNLAGCSDISGFKNILKDIWFGLYSRQAKDDTSGFEHVFVGEIKGTKVSGFHNWVHFYHEELAGNFNYQGYLSTQEPNIVGMRQTWYGATKSINGFTIGTSPEIELALYTLCHLARPNSKCNISIRDLDENVVSRAIQTYTWSNDPAPGGQFFVASAYFIS